MVLPLALCYVVFPISSYVSELTGFALWRNWIDLAWGLLGVGALIAGLAHGLTRQPSLNVWLGLCLCAIGLTWLSWGVLSGHAPVVTAAMEAKPVLYVLIALLLTQAFGLPSPLAFCRYGSALAVILLFETAVRSVVTGTIVRPVGSGEVNYDAALLCLALVFALSRRELAHVYGPVIFLGLLASFSRTSLLAASGALVFASTIPAALRVLMVGAAAGAGVMSFAIRDLEIGVLEGMDRYWMWSAGLEYLVSHAWSSAIGVVPGAAVDVDIPAPVADLWFSQQENINVDGIFPFHFHAMWLRFAIAWGWGLALLLALWLGYHAFVRRYRAPVAKTYFVVFMVLGLTMGLLYMSNVAVPYLLALNALLLEAKLWRQAVRRCSAAHRPMQPRPFALAPSQ